MSAAATGPTAGVQKCARKTVTRDTVVLFKLGNRFTQAVLPATETQSNKRDAPSPDESEVVRVVDPSAGDSDSDGKKDLKRPKKSVTFSLHRAATVEDFVPVSLIDEVPPKKNVFSRDYEDNVASSSSESTKKSAAPPPEVAKPKVAQQKAVSFEARESEMLALKADRTVLLKQKQEADAKIALLTAEVAKLKDEKGALQKLYDEIKPDPVKVRKGAVNEAAKEYMKDPAMASEIRKAARGRYQEENKGILKKEIIEKMIAEGGEQLRRGAYDEFLKRNPGLRPTIEEGLMKVMRNDAQVRAACQLRIKAEMKAEMTGVICQAAVDAALQVEREANNKRWTEAVEQRAKEDERRRNDDRVRAEDTARKRSNYLDLKAKYEHLQDEAHELRRQVRDRKRDRSRSRSRGSSSYPSRNP